MWITDLEWVDAAVEAPHGLEVLLHALFERLGDVVRAEEILEIPDLLLVVGALGVHALDDGRHVTEHHGVHQRYNNNKHSRLKTCVYV